MVVFFHIFIAILSIVFATVALFKPVRVIFQLSYGFMAATLISGVYLVRLAPEKMLHVCISGLLYTVIVGVVTALARMRYVYLQKGEQK